MNKKNIIQTSRPDVDPTEKQPCWYANLENGKTRAKTKWIVGVKKVGEEKNEYSFKVSKIGSVKDDKLWAQVSSLDFAIELIKRYRSGGKKEINEWIKNKCPNGVGI